MRNLVDEDYLSVLLLWRIRERAAERQGGNKQRTEDAFHAAPILQLAEAGSGCCLRAAEPFVETDAAEPRFAQWHERALLDPAAPVSGLGVAHHLARVADSLQIAGDDFVERCSFRAGDLDDAVSRRRQRYLGDDGGDVVRRDGLEQDGRKPDYVSFPLESAMPPRNSMNWVERMMV